MERTLILDCNQKVGKKVKICGWVQTRRDHGKIVFLDVSDRSGLIQVVMKGEIAGDLNTGDVIEVSGQVNKRPENLVNPKIPTGEIELWTEDVKVLSKSKTPPFPLDTDGYEIGEDLRLKYRYLDLRRHRMQSNIRLRHKFIKLILSVLDARDFVEIETPTLTESTPEGARDFLVPSRLQPGSFYALPQSPQQYKQLLMVAGFERYYQIARCFRDEDPRADRAYGEFTQLDLEMSFVKREDVMALTEELMIHVFESLGAKIKQKPFPVFTYKEAMEKFGADKFDLRTEEEKKANVQAFAWVVDFPFFEKTEEGGWTFTHNPFSAPKEEHKEWLLNGENIEDILTTQYDLVCNGYEVGGGSIRSHEPQVLFKVFEIMGYQKEEIEKRFGHMLEAFTLGVPPHGGIAPGIDRLLTCLTGERSLREVIAFPMSGSGRTAVMNAPAEVDEAKLNELGIAIKTK
ncbi:MAG: aspartate--tRNA ligase [Patescibacteria group bacterium]|nr:aspartate--tRNA ligase [Patescibacteria group bacterium]